MAIVEINEMEVGVFKGCKDNPLPEVWGKKDLYFYIQKKIGELKDEEVFNQKNYYMKIRGYYSKDLLVGFNKCKYCIYGNIKRNEDYNQFLDEDDNMCSLILVSKYIDFRNFDIHSVKIDCDYDFKVLQNMDNPLITDIKFYYEENTIWDNVCNWFKSKMNNDITF